MKIRTTVLCFPVRDLEKALTFYKYVFGLPYILIEDGMITVELPQLSLFLIEKSAFETYSEKAGREAAFPGEKAPFIVSCALTAKEEVDKALEDAPKFGGTLEANASIDESYGGYVGYISDPDGHLWELVYPPQQPGQ